MANTKLSVIIPSYRNPAYLDLCLKSAFENQDGDNQIIAILDGYVEESKHVINKYPDLNVVEFEENKGQTIAHNTGVWLAENEFILIVNEDNVFPRHWDTKLLESVKTKHGEYRYDLVVAPNQIEPVPSIFKSFIIKNFGVTPEEFDYENFLSFEESIHFDPSKHTNVFPYLQKFTRDGQTWPIFMAKRWYMILGGIDVTYPSAAVADWDFFLRCEMTGLHCIRYHGAHFYHFAGASTRKKISNWNVGELQSHQYFAYKWGYVPSLDSKTHSKYPPNKIVRGVRFRDDE